jgi:hypothetical protein
MPKLNRDAPITYCGQSITLPAGTSVKLVKGASGTQGDLYAVESVKLLIELTGNTHDPKYRYAFVPADAVDA